MSVCIATHERSELLRRPLASLAGQSEPAEEVLVSDASRGTASAELVRAAAASMPRTVVRHLPTHRRALPWQRWWAAQHATGDVVLFLDDDMRLAETALAELRRAYDALARAPDARPAGVGLIVTWDDGAPIARARTSWRERWLGTAALPPGRVTPGGLDTSLAGFDTRGLVAVEQLPGGAMSYRREVIAAIGQLDRLVDLYEAGIGRGEDVVLSACARRYGTLHLLTAPLALHPRETPDASRPYADAGWRMGLMGTWGRAHTLRWLATDAAAYRRTWARLALLEVGRAVHGIAARPWAGARWARLGGACAGIARALRHWRRIPPAARSDAGAGSRPAPGSTPGIVPGIALGVSRAVPASAASAAAAAAAAAAASAASAAHRSE